MLRQWIRGDELDSPEMKEFMEAWRNRRSDRPRRNVYVYWRNGRYHTHAQGMNPEHWGGEILSFLKVDNILDVRQSSTPIYLGGE